MRAYSVLVDGSRVGDVRPAATLSVAIAPGDHVIQGRIDWTGSSRVHVNFEPGMTYSMELAPRGVLPFALLLLLTPRQYLRLSLNNPE